MGLQEGSVVGEEGLVLGHASSDHAVMGPDGSLFGRVTRNDEVLDLKGNIVGRLSSPLGQNTIGTENKFYPPTGHRDEKLPERRHADVSSVGVQVWLTLRMLFRNHQQYLRYQCLSIALSCYFSSEGF